VIDPAPRFELSPYLYMQFMEPLGTTDGSVAAAWDFGRDRWRRFGSNRQLFGYHFHQSNFDG